MNGERMLWGQQMSFVMEKKPRTNSDKMKKKESDGLEPTGLIEGLKGYAVKRL